jgi:hypothetical protein
MKTIPLLVIAACSIVLSRGAVRQHDPSLNMMIDRQQHHDNHPHLSSDAATPFSSPPIVQSSFGGGDAPQFLGHIKLVATLNLLINIFRPDAAVQWQVSIKPGLE